MQALLKGAAGDVTAVLAADVDNEALAYIAKQVDTWGQGFYLWACTQLWAGIQSVHPALIPAASNTRISKRHSTSLNTTGH